MGSPGAGHCTELFLSGWSNETRPNTAPTIDNIMARSSVVYPSEPKMRLLHIATKGAQDYATTCIDQAGTSISPSWTRQLPMIDSSDGRLLRPAQ